ncbi:hypothetical protein S3E15_02881 [Bacillus mycoides]|uniref:Uncharacterized protein n=1 Tax=Bacillus mycoides TaxID=1405 RepID=A0AAP8BCN2_BACMY|nr:hypothetical protein S3E15_02881 [Bacillus mycoides]OSX98834.1 hypothetical protein BTJ44_00099 [Bacillus mycoides]OSY04946.1 hypothetical protein BTJ44_02303 [Bacillus mycoides]OSY09460.1 hypothetical protein BTJ48_02081 [Bacillus mycoides]
MGIFYLFQNRDKAKCNGSLTKRECTNVTNEISIHKCGSSI